MQRRPGNRSFLAFTALLTLAAPGCSTPSRSAAPPRAPETWEDEHAHSGSRHVTLMLGERWLDEGQWHPLDDQFTLGVEFDESNPVTGHGYELGLLHSGDDADGAAVPGFPTATSADFEVFELYGGYRHIFRGFDDDLHPYVSLGLSVMDGDLDVDTPGGSFSENDTAMGIYLRVGMLWNVTERMRLGLDVRHLVGDDWEVAGTEAESDYDQALLTLGWAF
jgi:hypothetical protein